MAERTLKTKLEISGAEEYKNAVNGINDRISVMNAEMRKVTAEYRDNANSTEALSKKNEILSRKLEEMKKKVEEAKKALQQANEQYGEGSEVANKYAKELLNAETSVINLEHAIQENESAMKGTTKTLGDLAEAFGVHLPSGVSTALDKVKGFSTASVIAVGAFSAAVAASVKVLKEFVSLTTEISHNADEILTLAEITGLNTDTIQQMQYAAEFIDVSFETIQGSLMKLTNKLQDAKDGSKATSEAFQELGVKIKENGELRSAEDVFYDLVDALGDVENLTERDAIAMDLLGKSAQDLNPLINKGSKALQEYGEEAKNVGAILSGEELAALGKVDDAYNKMIKTQDAIKQQMAAELAPTVEELYTAWTEFMLSAGQALVDSGILDMIKVILQNVTALISPVNSLAEDGIPKLSTAFAAFKTVLGAVAQLAAVISDAFSLIASVATLDWNGFKNALGLGYGSGNANNLQRTQMMQDGTWDQYYDYYNNGGQGYSANGTRLNASGDSNFVGGWTRVGENGPEMAYLPSGTTILNSQDSRAMTGGDVFNITIDARSVQEFNDIVRIVKGSRMAARMG